MRARTQAMATDLRHRVVDDAQATAQLRSLVEGAKDDDDLPARPYDDNVFTLTHQHAAFLRRIVETGGVERVIEFGAGYSTLVLAGALADAGGGTVTSIEDMPEWCQETLEQASSVAGADVRQVAGPMRLAMTPAGCVRVYASLDRAVADRGPYDLAFVDGPFWREGREGALYAALPYLRPGARVVLDDAGRPSEIWVLQRWLAACPGLRLEYYDQHSAGKGIAILRFIGPGEVTGSRRSVLDSFLLAGLLVAARALRRQIRRQL